MRRLAIGVSAAVLLLAILLGPSLLAPGPRGLTWLELTDGATGRRIFAGALADGEEIVLTWKNSLFGLRVTEVFVARAGRLDLTRVTFADPQGPPPPFAKPQDLDDLYHTGGPFHVEGLARPLTHAVFRIGEIGDPKLIIGNQTITLKQEVGFGGAVHMQTRSPRPRLDRSLGEIGAYLRDLFSAHS